MQVVVEGFSVLGEDGGEGYAPALCKGHGFHLAHYFLLHDAWNYGIPCHGMHLVAKVAGGVNGLYLYGLLDEPL